VEGVDDWDKSASFVGTAIPRRSTSSLGVMDALGQPSPRDRSLARWAGAFLGSSVLVTIGLVLLAGFASAPVLVVTAFPGKVLMSLIVATASIISAVVLARLGQPSPRYTRRLWRISLVANLIIVAILTSEFGVTIGLASCVMELVSIAFHVVALAMPTLAANDP
jgi:hypothetical protein